MPDLTMVIMQQCRSCGTYQSNTGGYKQILTDRFLPQCTCMAFRYSKHPRTCKHLEQAKKERCGWHQQYSGEVQSKSQMKKRICPKCGGQTENIFVGV